MKAKIALVLALVLAGFGYFGLCGSRSAAAGKEEPAQPSAPEGMALIPAGCFNMGNAFPKEEGIAKDSLPAHQVCLTKDFSMDVFEATNDRYQACVAAGKCKKPLDKTRYRRKGYYSNPEYAAYPVIGVSWNDAAAFCAFEGKRLPTEAEWEYAARGGLSGKRFPWGDVLRCADANWGRYEVHSPCVDANGRDNDTQKAGSYRPNGYGLYDMYGNVWEWVNDWYDKDYYQASPPHDPPGPEKGRYKVQRGGAYTSPDDDPGKPTVSWRSYNPAKHIADNLGFRCAAD